MVDHADIGSQSRLVWQAQHNDHCLIVPSKLFTFLKKAYWEL